MKRLAIVAAVAAVSMQAGAARPYGEVFRDSTLRIDYIFGGVPGKTQILLDRQTKTAGWAGRRSHMSELPIPGNGNITVSDPATGEVLYTNPFSSLYQEWVADADAESVPESFENTYLVPLPVGEADITLTLNDNRMQPMAVHKFRYQPGNELVEVRGVTPNEVRYMHRGGDPNECIDIAMVAEGYTAEEAELFFSEAKATADEILKYEPFASSRDRLNFVAVMQPSRESGISVPLEGKWYDTALGSHWSTFHSARYLTAPKVKALHDALTGVPYEHVMILANSDRYGGGGILNAYHMSTTRNKFSLPVTVHEFGHSFAGLADEYFYTTEESNTYPVDVEPWEKNITTLVDFSGKWDDLIEEGTPIPTPWSEDKGDRAETMKKRERQAQRDKGIAPVEKVGVYEGGGYKAKGVYRPVETCRMRDNFHPTFCPVCRRAIGEIIEFYSGGARN